MLGEKDEIVNLDPDLQKKWDEIKLFYMDQYNFEVTVPELPNLTYDTLWQQLDKIRQEINHILDFENFNEVKKAEQSLERSIEAIDKLDNILILFQAYYLIFSNKGADLGALHKTYEAWEPQIATALNYFSSVVLSYMQAVETDTPLLNGLNALISENRGNLSWHGDQSRRKRVRDAALTIMQLSESGGLQEKSLEEYVEVLSNKLNFSAELGEKTKYVTTIKTIRRNKEKEIRLEAAFANGMIGEWTDYPGLNSTADVVFCQDRILSRSVLKNANRPDPDQLWNFVWKHYDKDAGFLSAAGISTTNGPQDTLNALSILRSIRKRSDKIDYKGGEESISYLLSPNTIVSSSECPNIFDEAKEKHDELLLQARISLLDILNEEPIGERAGERPSTILDLYISLRIFIRLSKESWMYKNDKCDELLVGDNVDSFVVDAIGRDFVHEILLSLSEYLWKCESNAKHEGGFTLAPGSNEVCLTALYTASGIIEELKKVPGDLADYVLEKFHKYEDDCLGFVRSCWNDEEGGFSFIPGGAVELVHTLLGMRLEQKFLELQRARGLSLVDSISSSRTFAILGFLESCRKNDGYALLPEFWPSAYGTKLAIQIFHHLDFPVPGPHATLEFLRGLAIHSDDGAGRFLGYTGYQSTSDVTHRHEFNMQLG